MKAKDIGKKIEYAFRRSFISLLKYRGPKASPSSFPADLTRDPQILLLRQDRYGDAIISTPILRELHAQYPKGRFIILLGENNKGIADLLPFDCEIVIYRKKLFSDLKMLRILRRKKIDVLIDLMDNPSSTSTILISMISPRYAIGIEKENASSYQILVPLLDRGKFHIARRIAELLSPFGIDPSSVSLKPYLKDLSVVKKDGKAGIVLSAGAQNRNIPEKLAGEIASGLLREGFAGEVTILFQKSDEERAKRILQMTNDPRITLSAPTPSFAEFARKIAECEFIISPDTSSIHVCSAYGIPVIGLFVPFPPDLHYWTPIGIPNEIIIGQPNLDYVKAETVLEAARSLLKKIKPQQQEKLLTA